MRCDGHEENDSLLREIWDTHTDLKEIEPELKTFYFNNLTVYDDVTWSAYKKLTTQNWYSIQVEKLTIGFDPSREYLPEGIPIGFLPKNTTYLHLSMYNHPLTREVLPPKLKELHLRGVYNLLSGTSPPSLTHLTFEPWGLLEDHKDNDKKHPDIPDWKAPSGLTHLSLRFAQIDYPIWWLPANLTHLSLCNVSTKETGWLPKTLTHLKLRFAVEGRICQKSITQLMHKKLLVDLHRLTHLYLGTYVFCLDLDADGCETQVSFEELHRDFFPSNLTHLYLDAPLSKLPPGVSHLKYVGEGSPEQNGKISSMIVNTEYLILTQSTKSFVCRPCRFCTLKKNFF